MKKNKRPQLNSLQQSQLADCMRNGMNAPQIKPVSESKKGFSDTPLFSKTEQTKLF